MLWLHDDTVLIVWAYPRKGSGMGIITGDCLDVMAGMEPCSVDAIVTDPPYGLSFMGRDWDHGIPGEHFWREALRVAKPGAHLVAFGGTRTHHRLMCAIEDAGWEIRDCLGWLYGSGFPKSLDVSKAIDKAAGEAVEVGKAFNFKGGTDPKRAGEFAENGRTQVAYEPISAAAAAWQGWGTALKPSIEMIVLAQKPQDLAGVCGILAQRIGDAVCQLSSLAKDAGASSASSPSVFGGESDSALWSAVAECSTPDALYALMGTWPSESAIPSSLSIASSWLHILAVLSQRARTFTIETATELTTDLRILTCSPSPITADCIIEAATGQHGIGSSASLAASTFTVVAAKLVTTLEPSARGNAIGSSLVAEFPALGPIILARKPFTGTVAANVQEHGTGALNIDGCRVGTDGGGTHCTNRDDDGKCLGHPDRSGTAFGLTYHGPDTSGGRWPANIIHDGSDEVLAVFPNAGGGFGKRGGGASGAWNPTDRTVNRGQTIRGGGELVGFGDSGSAARFFYCAKASKSERDAGLDGFEAQRESDRVRDDGVGGDNPRNRSNRNNRNHHPTVKPLALMRWLVRLVTPPDGVVLDPFCGSGTTLLAAKHEGFDYIGIEKEAEYAAIAEARLAAVVVEEPEPTLF
jgi:DNA modification methylase